MPSLSWDYGLGDFTIGTSFNDDLFVIEPFGELDLATAPQLEKALGDAERSGAERIWLDLGGLDFIDCAGLGVLYEAASRSTLDGGRLRVTRGSEAVQRVIALCDLNDHLPFADN